MTYRLSTLLPVLLFLVSIPGKVAADPAKEHRIPDAADVFNELNLARTNPKAYARHLEDMRQYYNGKRFERPDEAAILTKEGVAAVDEAIAFLQTVEPVAALTLSPGMSKAAADHVRDQARTQKTGHRGSDASEPWDRVNRYGTWSGKIGENVAYGNETGREVVISLIVDDGVSDRGHRSNIFDPEYRFVGIASGTHSRWRTVCVTDYAHAYRE